MSELQHPPRLLLRGITKQYPGTLANDRVSLSIRAGEIHALLGENGAGKSTLMKIIYGVTQPDAGEILWEGQPVVMRDPAQARERGIGMVFQHFSLFETLSVAENIALAMGAAAGTPKQLEPKIREVSQRYGMPLEPQRLVHSLSIGERQRVEIVRCLMQDIRLLILDEPTSCSPAGGRRPVRGAAPAGRRGLQHPVHQPQAGRSARALRERHRAARRPRVR